MFSFLCISGPCDVSLWWMGELRVGQCIQYELLLYKAHPVGTESSSTTSLKWWRVFSHYRDIAFFGHELRYLWSAPSTNYPFPLQ